MRGLGGLGFSMASGFSRANFNLTELKHLNLGKFGDYNDQKQDQDQGKDQRQDQDQRQDMKIKIKIRDKMKIK